MSGVQAYLIIRVPDEPERIVPLEKDEARLGSHEENDVVIRHRKVSRKHARIFLEEDRFVVEDLMSANFLYVGSERVTRAVLEEGSRFTLGNAVSVEFHRGELPSDDLAQIPRQFTETDIRRDDEGAVEALLEIGAHINSSLDPAEVLPTILDRALTLARAERGVIMLLEDGELVTKVTRGMDDDTRPTDALYSSTVARKAIETRETIICSNLDANPEMISDSIIAQNIRMVMCAPMILHEQIVGCLYVDTSVARKFFSPSSGRLFTALANQAATAINNARINARLQKSLTEIEGLYEISRTLNAGSELAPTLELCLSLSRERLDVDRMGLVVFQEAPGKDIGGRFVKSVLSLADEVQAVEVESRLVERVKTTEESVKLQDLSGDGIPFFDRLSELFGRTRAVPLMLDGACMGALTLIGRTDQNPDDAEDVELLDSIAGLCVLSLQKDRVEKERLQQVRLQREMDDARHVQQLLIPRIVPRIPGYDLAARHSPANSVGGDYHDYLFLNDGRLVLVVADVAGHDIGSALIVSIGRTLLRTHFRTDHSPAEILSKISVDLVRDMKSYRYIALFLGILDPETGLFTYSNGGNIPPLLLRSGTTEFIELDKGGLPVGLIDGVPYEEETIRLDEGDLLVVATDGLIEARNPDSEFFGFDRMKQSLLDRVDTDAEQITDGLYTEAVEFTGNQKLDDDFTLMALRVVKKVPGAYLTLPTELSSVARSRLHAEQFLDAVSFEGDAEPILSSVEKAVHNAVAFGNEFEPKRAVALAMELREGHIWIEVSDEGLREHRENAPVGESATRETLELIRSWASAVTFNRTGNSVRMRFDLRAIDGS